ncbi:hypothetical protein [Nitrospira sp. Kam-Ns4a]
MALAHDLSSPAAAEARQRRCAEIRAQLIGDGLYDESPEEGAPCARQAGDQPGITTRWRIAPEPFFLSRGDVAFFEDLGGRLLAFYRALNRLYVESVRGAQPAWVADYLDQGKPDSLVSFARMKRFRDQLPAVIRPDIIPTEQGMVITELDSVPGGIGLTGALAEAYGQWAMGNGRWDASKAQPSSSTPRPSPGPMAPKHAMGAPLHPFELVGGADGMVRGFAAMLRHQVGDRPGCVAIVVSDEAKGYRPEMAWLAGRLRERGLDAWCVEPRDIRFTEEALLLAAADGRERPVAVVYRFFELFDLKNVPKAELIMYSAKKERTVVTPPFKPALEEKLAFALLHHPVLAPFWADELGTETFKILAALMPRTWVLDPRPIPPSAVVPDLRVRGRAVNDWRALAELTQKERRYVVKPSGFSELAWGSRGVSVGHDLPQAEWARVLEAALASFSTTPYILQEFHKGRQFMLAYGEPGSGEIVPMAGRARLSPYYFVAGNRVELGGILATVCSLEKKLIHGMRDAIMVPCAFETPVMDDE